MATDKQVRYIMHLLYKNGYSVKFMDSKFKNLGVTMNQRRGTVEYWANSLSSGEASNIIEQLK